MSFQYSKEVQVLTEKEQKLQERVTANVQLTQKLLDNAMILANDCYEITDAKCVKLIDEQYLNFWKYERIRKRETGECYTKCSRKFPMKNVREGSATNMEELEFLRKYYDCKRSCVELNIKYSAQHIDKWKDCIEMIKKSHLNN